MKNVPEKLKNALKTESKRFYIAFELFYENGLANHAAACAYGFLLSMAPMLLLLAFFIYYAFRPSPEAITALISNIPFLGSLFDEQWLHTDFFSFAAPNLSGVISVLGILWAGRILALSIQRGLKIIFHAEKERNPVTDTFVTFAIEVSVIIFVMAAIVSSRAARVLYRLLDFIPNTSFLQFLTSHTGSQISYIFLLGLAVFLAYLFVPANSPRKFSAFKGTLFCILAYFCVAFFLGYLMDKAKYSLLYGALGNMIVLLVNVYFFFFFFFLGAQLAHVRDSFDSLKDRVEGMVNRFKRRKKPE
jgi:membrane protein